MKNKKYMLPLLSLFIIPALYLLSGCGTFSAQKDRSMTQRGVCGQKADEALKNRNYEKSIILHEFFLEENPHNGLALYHTGFSYGQLGDHASEVKYYENAIDSGYFGSGIFFNLGMAYGEMGEFDDAVRIFKKAIKTGPARADHHFGLGLTYKNIGNKDLAKAEFIRAVELDPMDLDSIYSLGMLYIEEGRVEKAEKQLGRLMEIDPDNSMTLAIKEKLEYLK